MQMGQQSGPQDKIDPTQDPDKSILLKQSDPLPPVPTKDPTMRPNSVMDQDPLPQLPRADSPLQLEPLITPRMSRIFNRGPLPEVPTAITPSGSTRHDQAPGLELKNTLDDELASEASKSPLSLRDSSATETLPLPSVPSESPLHISSNLPSQDSHTPISAYQVSLESIPISCDDNADAAQGDSVQEANSPISPLRTPAIYGHDAEEHQDLARPWMLSKRSFANTESEHMQLANDSDSIMSAKDHCNQLDLVDERAKQEMAGAELQDTVQEQEPTREANEQDSWEADEEEDFASPRSTSALEENDTLSSERSHDESYPVGDQFQQEPDSSVMHKEPTIEGQEPTIESRGPIIKSKETPVDAEQSWDHTQSVSSDALDKTLMDSTGPSVGTVEGDKLSESLPERPTESHYDSKNNEESASIKDGSSTIESKSQDGTEEQPISGIETGSSLAQGNKQQTVEVTIEKSPLPRYNDATNSPNIPEAMIDKTRRVSWSEAPFGTVRPNVASPVGSFASADSPAQGAPPLQFGTNAPSGQGMIDLESQGQAEERKVKAAKNSKSFKMIVGLVLVGGLIALLIFLFFVFGSGGNK